MTPPNFCGLELILARDGFGITGRCFRLFVGVLSKYCRCLLLPAAGLLHHNIPEGCMKIAIFATHPIQYYVPWFRLLAQQPDIELKVYYAMLPDKFQQGVGFGVPFTWDVPLLEGYQWECLPNGIANPALGRFFGSSTPDVYDKLLKNYPDLAIISGWNALPMLQALWACIRLRIPRIVRGDSNALKFRPWYVRILHRIFMQLFDAFLVTGKSNRDFYLQAGIAESRLFPCRHFVDNKHFISSYSTYSDQKDTLRDQWRIPAECCCFLYVGKLEPKKRILDLIEAMFLLNEHVPNVHLLVVGTGELFNQAEARALDLGVPVTFAGFLNQSELPKAYVVSDCLVLPSDYGETWGLVVNEAMVCGIPVIVSDRVGSRLDRVEDSRPAMLLLSEIVLAG